jgi:TP901 family phage tail tape measure protein
MAQTVYQILVRLEGDEKARAGIENLGAAAGLSGAALTTFAAGAGKLAVDYEFALQKVQTVGNETTGTLKEFDQAVYELSEQMNGAISVNEAAIASYDIASAGYKDQAEILGILEITQKAAIGGYSDLGTVSDATTTIMNAFGDSLGENLSVQERAQKVTDLLIQTQNDGKTTVDELAASYGQIAATAASAGVEFEVVNAFLANSTAQGLQTNSAISGLNQVIAGIQKPTAEAREEAERLGISFDATALKTKGLDGIMLEIANSSNLADDSIAKLFGSTEAQTVMNQALANSGQNVVTALNNQYNAIGTTSEAYSQMADTDAVKAQQALNKLQNTIIKLGQGVAVAVEPAIDALNFLVDNFAKLPEPMQHTIGIMTLIGGVALTAAGGILMIASNVATMSQNVAAAIPYVTKMLGQMTAMQGLNLAGMAGGLKAFGAAAAAAAPLLVAAAGAVASVTLAVKQYQNIKTQFRNEEIQGYQEATQPLVNYTSQVVHKMHEMGKALPEDEFNKLISTLEGANSEYGELDGVIQAVKNVQEKYKKGTEESTKATEENTESNQENKQSEEELAEAEKERAAKFAEYVQKQQQLNSSLDQQRTNRLTQIDLEKTSEVDTINAKLAANRQYYDQIANNQRDLLLQSQLTAEQRRQIEISLQQTLNNIARAEAEARRALMEQSINALRLEIESAQSEIESQIGLANVAKSQNDATLQYLQGATQLRSRIAELMEDENSSLAFQNELHGISVGINQSLIDMGIEINDVVDERAGMQGQMLAIEQIEIEIKKQQLELEREILTLEAEGRRAEIEGQIEINKLKRDNAQTEEERRSAELAIEIEQRKLGVLDKQTEAKMRQNELDRQIADFESQVNQAQINEANRDARSPSGQAGQPPEARGEGNDETTEATKEVAENVQRNTESLDNVANTVGQQTEQTQQQTQAFENSNQVLGSIDSGIKGILENTGALVRQLDFVQKQIRDLPGQIASRIPRPRPSKSRK